jgi:general stress protein 26
MPAMSDYGLSADTWQPLPWEWAAERLAGTHNFWLCTVGPSGQPHSMPVWGVWDDATERFAFGCSPSSKKLRNISGHPAVTFTNDDTVECVSVQGRASAVTDGADIDRWIPLFVAKYGAESGPDFGDFMRSHPLVEVAPTIAFGLIERVPDFNTRATRWRFS